jgi:hypothetical protein
MADVDRPPTEIKEEQNHNFMYYSKPDNFAKIIGNKKLVFGLWGLVGYVGQFLLIVAGLNVYSDEDRFKQGCDPSTTDANAQSDVYDTALRLLCAYHIIEWVRMTLFLVIMLLGQKSLMWLWYPSCLNVIFGLAAYISCHIAYFSDPGKGCRDIQLYRGHFLLAEVIIFWTSFHIMSFPHAFLFMKKSYIEEALNDEVEEEENEEGEKKD